MAGRSRSHRLDAGWRHLACSRQPAERGRMRNNPRSTREEFNSDPRCHTPPGRSVGRGGDEDKGSGSSQVYLTAMKSISTAAPAGNAATPTVERLGLTSTSSKNSPYTSFSAP